MANPLEIVKAHPVMSGAAVLAVIVIFFVVGSGGGSQTVSEGGGTSDSQVAAGLQMQQISAAAAAQAGEVAAKRELGLAQIAAGLEEAKINATASFNANTLAANLGLATVASNEKIQSLTSTLDAQVKGQQIQAEENKNKSMFDYLTFQTASQRDTTLAGYNAQLAITQDNNRPKGLFSFLFG